MGLSPSKVKGLTMWEYMACIEGWNRSQGKVHAVEGGPLSDADYDALCELGESWSG
jgi:hypothetical protein